MINPFKFGTIVEGDYFTDRVAEQADLLHKLNSNNHIVLISPRRFGKSSLVNKVLPQTGRPYITVDMQYTISPVEFSTQLMRALFKEYPYEKIRHLLTHFRIVPTLSTNALTGVTEISFQPHSDETVLLEDVMSLISKVTTPERRLIVVIDEFQEVTAIAKGFDRQLRSLMQRQQDINYVLLGSQESIMEEIFEKKKSPFYHFGQLVRLPKIPYPDFFDYVSSRLPKTPATDQIAAAILDITSCHPYYTQQLAAQVWDIMTYYPAILSPIDEAMVALSRLHDLDYERLWLSLNRTDKTTIRRLANGELPMRNISIPSSTVQSSLKRLSKAGYIINDGSYEIEDPFFCCWLKSKLFNI